MENHTTSKCGFLHLVVIWYEVMNHVEYFRKEWTDDVPLSFRMGKKDNDSEINVNVKSSAPHNSCAAVHWRRLL